MVRPGGAWFGGARHGSVGLGKAWAPMAQEGDKVEYQFSLKGMTPLLMHRDDVMEADELSDWRKDPRNKAISVPGDDRSPPWSWMTYLYHDGTHLVIPQENIMVALRTAGAKIPGKGRSTFKALSQSGLFITGDCGDGGEFCRFTHHGEQVALADIREFRDLPFKQHIDHARKLGFDLLVKRAKVGTSKHVRVRPKFVEWSVEGTILVNEPAITADVLAQMFTIAGRYAGLCDWRPSSEKSPGPYGMFDSEVKPLKGRKVA
jgi:hypothetical protein